MSNRLNSSALSHARSLVRAGKVDKSDSWSAPSADEENSYIKNHGMAAFGKWFLGTKAGEDPKNKGHYSYPFSHNFESVSRKGVIAIKQRAAQQGDSAIEGAADRLLKMIDGDKDESKAWTIDDAGEVKITWR